MTHNKAINKPAALADSSRWWTVVLLTLLYSLMPGCGQALAQKLTASAPQQVAVGQQFRLSYQVNTQDVRDFSLGRIPEEFSVLMGPSTSRQNSVQIVNGHASQSSSITITYILVATKNGTYTIPAASIVADGQQLQSNALKISVEGQSQSSGGSSAGGRQGQPSGQPSMRDAGTTISASDLFIKVSASKKRVVEQEPVLLTYKVYTLLDLTQLEGKMPDLKGFHTQEVALPQQKSFKIEQLNGRNYRTVTWSQYVMFPQVTGKLTVPSIAFNGIVVQRNRNVDPFEAFFNGGSGYVEVKKTIQAPSIDIQVDPLPDRPAGFSGGVGRFTVSASLDKETVKANDPITLRVVVSGAGNLQLVKQPVVAFPKDFDTYDAKQTDKTRLTTAGVEGSVVYEYLAVPRHQGDFEIPAIEFVYYDTAAKQYKTSKTQSFTVHVDKGEGGSATVVQDFTGQEDVRLLANDIRHIKLGPARLAQPGEHFFGSTWYWVAIAVLLGLFVSLFVVFRQRAIANADVVGSRAGKASKVATKRLKKASKLMQESRPGEFYDEVLRALWGYVGDKLNIPVAQLSQDNIRERLEQRGADGSAIDQFMGALEECEFERYAPGDPRGNMNKVYTKAMTAIEKIENTMKKRRTKGGAPRPSGALLLLAMFTLWTTAAVAGGQQPLSPALPADSAAVLKTAADSAYVQGRYQEAIALYDSLLHHGVSAELYYNLGNAYYRNDDITRAVLSYERALQLSPGDADVRFNLQMARSRTVDKIVPESEMFFFTWYRSLAGLASADGWGSMALGALALAVVLALIYLFIQPVLLRKIGFFGALFMLFCFAVFNVLGYSQLQDALHRRGAIVVSAAVSVKSTPDQNGTDLFILHEGTKVTVTDATMRHWKEVRVADGKQGWLPAKAIELI